MEDLTLELLLSEIPKAVQIPFPFSLTPARGFLFQSLRLRRCHQGRLPPRILNRWLRLAGVTHTFGPSYPAPSRLARPYLAAVRCRELPPPLGHQPSRSR